MQYYRIYYVLMCVIILGVWTPELENFLLTREEGKGWLGRHPAQSPEPGCRKVGGDGCLDIHVPGPALPTPFPFYPINHPLAWLLSHLPKVCPWPGK